MRDSAVQRSGAPSASLGFAAFALRACAAPGGAELAVAAAACRRRDGGCSARRAAVAVACAVALLLPAGAASALGGIAAIDRSELAPLAGREVTLRGYVMKRERTSFGTRRVRVRVTRSADRARPRVHELVQLRVHTACATRGRRSATSWSSTARSNARGGARAPSTTRPTCAGRACTRSFARAARADRPAARRARRRARRASQRVRRPGFRAGPRAAARGARARDGAGRGRGHPGAPSEDFKRSGSRTCSRSAGRT